MIGAKELALMKKSAYLVNVARAPIVDREALYTALSNRKIAGAVMYFGKNHLTLMINY